MCPPALRCDLIAGSKRRRPLLPRAAASWQPRAVHACGAYGGASAAQALAARLADGLFLPLLDAAGPVAVARGAAGGAGGADEAAELRWRPDGAGAPVEAALLECLAFQAGARVLAPL